MKSVLIIAGSDSSAGAGMQADLKTLSGLGIYAATVVTAVTSQNQAGVLDVYPIPADIVVKQIDAALSSASFDAVKTGMLGTKDAVMAITERLKKYKIKKLVVDPVFCSSSGVDLLSRDALPYFIKELIPLSCLITPNIDEASRISGIAISDEEGMIEAARYIHKLGAKNVLVKGGHLAGDAVDILYDGYSIHRFIKKRLIHRNIHGTGCILSAYISGEIAKGISIEDAVCNAKRYVYNLIEDGAACEVDIKHDSQIELLGERGEILRSLAEAIDAMKGERIGRLIPEIQSNLAYALPHAKSLSEVGAVPGRIIKLGDDIHTIASPSFGASSHIGKVVLTALRYDGSKRACMNIKYDRKLIAILKKLHLKTGEFDRNKEPKRSQGREGSTIEWGTKEVIERLKRVPDAIYDKGGTGKEPVIRLLAEDPLGIVRMIKKINRFFV